MVLTEGHCLENTNEKKINSVNDTTSCITLSYMSKNGPPLASKH